MNTSMTNYKKYSDENIELIQQIADEILAGELSHDTLTMRDGKLLYYNSACGVDDDEAVLVSPLGHDSFGVVDEPYSREDAEYIISVLIEAAQQDALDYD